MTSSMADTFPGSTRARVLDLIRTRGQASRVELAAATGLTPGTITNAVRGLVDDRLVREAGRVPSDGGSPRRLLELDPRAAYSLGVQMDRSTSSIVLADFTGRILAEDSVRGAGEDPPDVVLTAIAGAVTDLLDATGVPKTSVMGVGLVTHGPQDQGRGMVLGTRPTPAWSHYPLTDTLSDAVDLPVLLENDATAAALGEQWLGEVTSDSFGVLYLASGLGGGVVNGGEVYRGPSFNSVEIGHITIDADGPLCDCGNRGCVEATSGTAAVVLRAMTEGVLPGRLSLSGERDRRLADFQLIAQAAHTGDPQALELVRSAATGLGHAAVTLVNLFGLDTVVLAGPGFSVAGSELRDGITRVLHEAAFSRELAPVDVRLSVHGSIAAALGGALLVLRSGLPTSPTFHA